MTRKTAIEGSGTVGVRGHLFAARVIVVIEQLIARLWPAAALAQLFLAIALFDLLPELPGYIHAGVLAAFALLFVVLLIGGLSRLTWPSRSKLIRRIELDSDLANRPLASLSERLSAGAHDPGTVALWRLHRERARRAAEGIRIGIPRPQLAKRDPQALGAAAALVLVVAATGTWGDWRPRVDAAVTPTFAAPPPVAPPTLDAWLSPPAYTGLPPILLVAGDRRAPADQVVGVPEGSVLLAQVSASAGITPDLAVNAGIVPFTALDSDHHEISQPITGGNRIAVLWGGRELGAWPVRLVADQPPRVAFSEAPSSTSRATLRIDYTAGDDYGVELVTATVEPLPSDQNPLGMVIEPVELPLGIPPGSSKVFSATSFQDLTAHPWAGLPASITLTAGDATGQTVTSEPVTVQLPARVFAHPVARRLIEARRRLTRKGEPAREPVAHTLRAISTKPQSFHDDTVLFLGLRVAAQRLDGIGADTVIPEVQALLWDLALRLEDGGISLAERELRDAQQALAEALERDAGADELDELMNELQAALDRYLDALEQQARETMLSGQDMPGIPPEFAQNILRREDLQAMFERMRDLAETGSREAAREMLSQLQEMLETMQTGQMTQVSQPPSQGFELLQQMQGLAMQQQMLMDQTFRMDQIERQQGPYDYSPQSRARRNQAMERMQDFADQQNELRQGLGELMRQMGELEGEIPSTLGNAELAMRQAEQALRNGSAGTALAPQAEAIEQLQQGLGDMAQQLMQQMMGEGMQPGGGRGLRGQQGRDPLGRPLPGFGNLDANDVAIPDQQAVQRAREILDELRRRAGERGRPQLELDYIDRLLRQF